MLPPLDNPFHQTCVYDRYDIVNGCYNGSAGGILYLCRMNSQPVRPSLRLHRALGQGGLIKQRQAFLL